MAAVAFGTLRWRVVMPAYGARRITGKVLGLSAPRAFAIALSLGPQVLIAATHWALLTAPGPSTLPDIATPVERRREK